MTAADLALATVDGGHQPGTRQQPRQVGGEHRLPAASALQAIQRPLNVPLKTAGVDPIVLQQARQIRVVGLQQLEQHVLDIDLVMAPRQAQARRCLQRLMAGLVHFSRQGFQICIHRTLSPKKRAFPLMNVSRFARRLAFRVNLRWPPRVLPARALIARASRTLTPAIPLRRHPPAWRDGLPASQSIRDGPPRPDYRPACRGGPRWRPAPAEYRM